MNKNLQWATYDVVDRRRSLDEGVALLDGNTVVGIVREDRYADDGVAVEVSAQMLTWAGVPQTAHIRWTPEQFEAHLANLPDDRIL